MNAITLLTRSSGSDLTPEEDAQLTRELAAAYHMDEASATSREVQRIAEKIRARLDADALRTIDPPDEETSTAHLCEFARTDPIYIYVNSRGLTPFMYWWPLL